MSHSISQWIGWIFVSTLSTEGKNKSHSKCMNSDHWSIASQTFLQRCFCSHADRHCMSIVKSQQDSMKSCWLHSSLQESFEWGQRCLLTLRKYSITILSSPVSHFRKHQCCGLSHCCTPEPTVFCMDACKLLTCPFYWGSRMPETHLHCQLCVKKKRERKILTLIVFVIPRCAKDQNHWSAVVFILYFCFHWGGHIFLWFIEVWVVWY